MVSLVTAGELRTYLQLDPDDVTELPAAVADQAIAGVSGLVLTYCRRATFAVVEVTARLNGNGAREILLPGAPVTEVASVVEDPAGSATGLTVGSDVDWSEDGILERVGGRFARRRRWYEVTFSHGYADGTPDDVKLVVNRVATRAITNPEGLATEGVGGYNAGFAFDETRLPTLSRPDRRDLDEYRL